MTIADNIIFIRCSCGSEVMSIERDEEDGLYYIAIYSHHPVLDLWGRIRFIWQVLTTGRAYNDQIVIVKEDAVGIADFLK